MDYHKFTNYKKMVMRQKWAQDGKNQTYLEIGLTFGAIIFFTVFALRPTLLTISELTKDKQSLEDLNVKLDDKIEALVAAQEAYEKAEPKLQLIEHALPKDESVTQFIGQVEIISGETKTTIEDLTFESYSLNNVTENSKTKQARTAKKRNTKETPQEWLELPFRVTATGDFGNIRDFIISIGKLRRLVLIDSVNINRPSNNNQNNQQGLRLIVEGRIVYYP